MMTKLFTYSKKSIMLHTIFLIVLIAITSSTLFIIPKEINIYFIISYSTVIGLYFIYVLAGYIIFISNYLKYKKEKGSLIKQFKTDNVYRVIITNSFGAAYALIFAVINHTFLYLEKNVFYLLIEEIYLFIGLVKIYLVFDAEKPSKQYSKTEIIIDVFLFATSIAVFWCSLQVYFGNGTFNKNEIMVYAYALYAFYSFISAIASFIKARKLHNLARMRFFMVKFAVACFSMFVLAVSLLNQFSGNPEKAILYELIIGFGAGIIIFVEAVLLAIKIRKYKNLAKNIANE